MQIFFGQYELNSDRDPKNVLVIRHGTSTNKETGEIKPTQSVRGYYSSVKNALCAIIDFKIADGHAKDVQGVIDHIEKVKNEVISTVTMWGLGK